MHIIFWSGSQWSTWRCCLVLTLYAAPLSNKPPSSLSSWLLSSLSSFLLKHGRAGPWLSLWFVVWIHKSTVGFGSKVSVVILDKWMCIREERRESDREDLYLLWVILRRENPLSRAGHYSVAVQVTTQGLSGCWCRDMDWFSSLCWAGYLQQKQPDVFLLASNHPFSDSGVSFRRQAGFMFLNYVTKCCVAKLCMSCISWDQVEGSNMITWDIRIPPRSSLSRK